MNQNIDPKHIAYVKAFLYLFAWLCAIFILLLILMSMPVWISLIVCMILVCVVYAKENYQKYMKKETNNEKKTYL